MPDPHDPEVIAVRDEERFDEAALRDFLKGRVEGADRPLEVEQFGGGHANLTYLLRFGRGEERVEYVLRRPPLGPVAPGSHDMHREYRALSRLWEAFPPAPRAYVFCEDDSVIGAPFLVMERRHGVVVRREVPEIFGGGRDAEANRRLSEVVIDTLVEFHAVEPAPIGLDSLGRNPEGFMERQVEGWASRFERAKTADLELADELVRWLRENRPASPAPTLLHNDWRLDNMAVAHDDPGRCTAVYDWDMCTVGDPLADLGTLVALWAHPDDLGAALSPMPVKEPGFLHREQAMARYAERSGRDLSAIAWYDVFGTFKMGVVLQQIYFRYHQGQTRDARFASMGEGARSLYELAASRRP